MPLGVFSSSLAEAALGFAFFWGGANVFGAAAEETFAGASKPELPGANWSAMFVVVVAARMNMRVVVTAGAGGRARKADLLKLASVAIRIHVPTARKTVANSFVARAKKADTKYETKVRGVSWRGKELISTADGDSSV